MKFSDLKSKLTEPRVVLAVWSLATLYAGIMKALSGPLKYNNFMIFRGVADHLFASLPLYELYPLEYRDMNHYGPIFGFIIAPFSALPHWLAMPLWVVCLSALLYWAVRRLPLPVRLSSLVLLLAANDFYSAALMQQFNIAVAGLLAGSLAMIQKRREGWAALFIVIGTFVKIYGVVGLAFFFFVERKWRFIGFMALYSALALLLPLLFVTPEYLLTQYIAWAVDITQKNAQNMFCAYTNISFLGFVRKTTGSANYSDLLIMVPAVVLFLLSYLRIKQYKFTAYRLTMLASLLLFIVVFSSGSENSGYVIAAIGAGIWWVTLAPARRGKLEWTLLALMLAASFANHLMPRKVYIDVYTAYALRSLPYFLIWLHCIGRLWFEDFAAADRALEEPRPDPESDPCSPVVPAE